MSYSVKKYIDDNWEKCTNENRFDKDTLIGMPYPYSIPAVGHFDEMYYWDTYFTNKGLEIEGMYMQAKCNVDNMLYIIDRFGFMLNANRSWYIDTNSQPPFSSMMVRDIYEHYCDKAWLNGAYVTLKKEYDFWMTKRNTPIGLNRYDGTINETEFEHYYEQFIKRADFKPNGLKQDIARHMVGICECGWDINPRFETEIYNFAPVDLNSLLYAFERNMAYFSSEIGVDSPEMWNSRAIFRKEKMYKYLLNEDGIMMDYNFEKKCHSKYFSVASYYPMFVQLVEEDYSETLKKNLTRLETEYGILTVEKHELFATYQWDYPIGWAPMQYIMIEALNNYGYISDAKRIAQKYILLADKVFEETNNLWEKYNIVEGNINVMRQENMPPMMGWSAGTYLFADKFCTDN